MKLTLRVIAVLSFIISIIWMIVHPSFDPLLALLAGASALITSFIVEKPKGVAETLDQGYRRMMLNYVEEYWVKGILEKSLNNKTLLDLEIKEDPDALYYPRAIKREVTKETLPVGTSMLEIFQGIGLGRSLLILGAPGSGKTTMLLELTRQLIERARQDVTEPIPVVFNLSSYTEKLTLADWLARELNIFYTIPKQTAPNWVKENKMLLLLDGLDEVKQECRDKCVEAINQFRNENGLTNVAVCIRIQDYAEIKTRLSFNGAIEIQPLTTKQLNDYFKRFGKELSGIKQVLEKDAVLRKMAETPLFLSIMAMVYLGTQSKDILVAENVDVQRNHLFDTYIECMFERPGRPKNELFKKQDVLRWLSWLAQKMIEHNQVPYLLENMQPSWLSNKKRIFYQLIAGVISGMITMLSGWIGSGMSIGLVAGMSVGLVAGLGIGLKSTTALVIGLLMGLSLGLASGLSEIEMVDAVTWDWRQGGKGLMKVGLLSWLISWVILVPLVWLRYRPDNGLYRLLLFCLIFGLIIGLLCGLGYGLFSGLISKPINQTTYPGQRIYSSKRGFFIVFLLTSLIFGSVSGLLFGLNSGLLEGLKSGVLEGLIGGLSVGLSVGVFFGFFYGGNAVIEHYILRTIMRKNNDLPWKLVPFLNYCTDLIFFRRVGGGYIFVHRLLMEHFAAMYPKEQT